MKKINAKLKEEIERLLDETKVAIVSTDNGTVIVGNKMLILNQLENIANNLAKCDISKEEAIYAVKSGYSGLGRKYFETLDQEIEKFANELKKKLFEED